MRVFKFIIFAFILLTFNNKFGSARSIKVRRSNPTTTENPCQEYSKAGDCLGDIDEELVEYKCMFCVKKCKVGAALDRFNICRKVNSSHISKHPNKL